MTLTATGCPPRENSRFLLTVRIERSDRSGVDGADKTTYGDPFRSDGGEGTSYSCIMELALRHPPVERADYTIYLMWPGEEGTETATFESTCVSDGEQAECRKRDEPAGGHAEPRADGR